MPTTPSLDPAWLDREYNNRALVPEHVDIFARWARDSAVARQAPGALIDVPYGSGAGEMIDIFPAEGGGAAPAPVLFFIHGGWWRSLDKADHSFVAPPFTRRGACVVMPNYALCPAVTIPHITLQMVQALAWTFRHIAAHGGDPRRITVIGHSAGGHLASMLMNCSWQLVGADLPADLPRNGMTISGVHDLQPVMHTPFVQTSLGITPQQVAMASPARLPAPRLRNRRGQIEAFAGGIESSEFRRQTRILQQAWGHKVVPVCEELPGLNHFTVVDALADPAHRLHARALALLGLT